MVHASWVSSVEMGLLEEGKNSNVQDQDWDTPAPPKAFIYSLLLLLDHPEEDARSSSMSVLKVKALFIDL